MPSADKLKEMRSMSHDIANEIPPHDADSEVGALGAMLMERSCAEIVTEELTPADFYVPAHRALYRIMMEMFNGGQELDEITVVSEATRRGVLDDCGVRVLIGSLITKASPTSVETYTHAIRERAEQRQLWELAQLVSRMGHEHATPDEILAKVHAVADGIEQRRAKLNADAVDLHALAVNVAKDALEGEARDTWGLPTGIAGGALDARIGGIQAGTYVVLAGRASMGKSTFAYAIARGVRRCNPAAGIPLIISNEMLPEAVARASLASEAGIHPAQLLSRKLGSEQRARVQAVIDRKRLAGVSVVHLAGATVPQVKALATRHQREHGLPLLVVDLAGRLHAPGDSEYLQLKNVSRGLQALAGVLRTCILACVQVSRGAMMNTDKRPDLKDLKGCGSWEEDADQVVFLHRPAYYGGKDHRTEIILAKDRIVGNTGSTWIRYDRNAGQYLAEEENADA
jgi:replicative DNA helicase